MHLPLIVLIFLRLGGLDKQALTFQFPLWLFIINGQVFNLKSCYKLVLSSTFDISITFSHSLKAFGTIVYTGVIFFVSNCLSGIEGRKKVIKKLKFGPQSLGAMLDY